MAISTTDHRPEKASPFALKNIRLYVAFRIFFNGRFYYPVFTILFLDFGLTLDQFALLNAVWAATIVLMEVPSGALADIMGRKNLLVFTGVLMIIEMALLCVVPLGNAGLLFAVFLMNRVLSGTAEAAASGADEALAYDTLKTHGNAADWDKVLERQMRFQSMGFVLISSIGAAVYDPELMQKVGDWLGLRLTFTQSMTLRFPVYLTLIMAVMALVTTLRMQEVNTRAPMAKGHFFKQCRTSIIDALRLTLKAGAWILKTPFAVIIIASGMLFDHVVRLLITLNSQYFRLIHLPEATFGLIGSGMALLGLFIPRLARRMAENRTPAFNLYALGCMTVIGLYAMTWFIPYFGLAPMLLLYAVMMMTGFFLSHYLNQITDSDQRATVLSFRGLSYNLAYGLIGVMYSGLLAVLRAQIRSTGVRTVDLENSVFIDSIGWFPGYFIAGFILIWIWGAIRLRHINGITP
jgi:MFS family permease